MKHRIAKFVAAVLVCLFLVPMIADACTVRSGGQRDCKDTITGCASCGFFYILIYEGSDCEYQGELWVLDHCCDACNLIE